MLVFVSKNPTHLSRESLSCEKVNWEELDYFNCKLKKKLVLAKNYSMRLRSSVLFESSTSTNSPSIMSSADDLFVLTKG